MASEEPDYYAILGLDPEADDDAVRKAWRKCAARWHPDRNPEALEEAHSRFLEASAAFEVLGHPQRRASYDRRLRWRARRPSRPGPFRGQSHDARTQSRRAGGQGPLGRSASAREGLRPPRGRRFPADFEEQLAEAVHEVPVQPRSEAFAWEADAFGHRWDPSAADQEAVDRTRTSAGKDRDARRRKKAPSHAEIRRLARRLAREEGQAWRQALLVRVAGWACLLIGGGLVFGQFLEAAPAWTKALGGALPWLLPPVGLALLTQAFVLRERAVDRHRLLAERVLRDEQASVPRR